MLIFSYSVTQMCDEESRAHPFIDIRTLRVAKTPGNEYHN